jgi:hypothetical protein
MLGCEITRQDGSDRLAEDLAAVLVADCEGTRKGVVLVVAQDDEDVLRTVRGQDVARVRGRQPTDLHRVNADVVEPGSGADILERDAPMRRRARLPRAFLNDPGDESDAACIGRSSLQRQHDRVPLLSVHRPADVAGADERVEQRVAMNIDVQGAEPGAGVLQIATADEGLHPVRRSRADGRLRSAIQERHVPPARIQKQRGRLRVSHPAVEPALLERVLREPRRAKRFPVPRERLGVVHALVEIEPVHDVQSAFHAGGGLVRAAQCRGGVEQNEPRHRRSRSPAAAVPAARASGTIDR